VIYSPPVRFLGVGFTKSWNDWDYEKTYNAPPVTAPLEHQVEYDKWCEKEEIKRREDRDAWSRKENPKSGGKVSFRVALFNHLKSLVSRCKIGNRHAP